MHRCSFTWHQLVDYGVIVLSAARDGIEILLQSAKKTGAQGLFLECQTPSHRLMFDSQLAILESSNVQDVIDPATNFIALAKSDWFSALAQHLLTLHTAFGENSLLH